MAKEKDIKKNKKTTNKEESKKVVVKKQAKNNKPKEKFIVGIKKELKLVKWPTLKEIIKYTVATIMFCVILVIFFELLSLLMAFVKGMFN